MEEKNVQLRKFFENKGFTQEKVSELLGVDKALVNKLMNGKKQFGKQTARKWSDLFGLSYIWLLTGEGSMEANSGDILPESSVPYNLYKDLLDKYETVVRENERIKAALLKYECNL